MYPHQKELPSPESHENRGQKVSGEGGEDSEDTFRIEEGTCLYSCYHNGCNFYTDNERDYQGQGIKASKQSAALSVQSGTGEIWCTGSREKLGDLEMSVIIKIKEEYASLVPGMSSQEYQSMKENGQHHLIIINNEGVYFFIQLYRQAKPACLNVQDVIRLA